jgi:hypothetical protein
MPIVKTFTDSDFDTFSILLSDGAQSWSGGNSFLGTAVLSNSMSSVGAVRVTAQLSAAALATLPVGVTPLGAIFHCTHALTGSGGDVTFQAFPGGIENWDSDGLPHSGSHDETTFDYTGSQGHQAVIAGAGSGGNTVSAMSFDVRLPLSIDPGSGAAGGGNTVTITGYGFDGGTTVDFDGTPATSIVSSMDGTSLTCVAPAHTAGIIDVLVTTVSNGSDTVSYEYLDVFTGPDIDPGPVQVVTGPGPATFTTDVTVTPGSGSIVSYTWTQVDGPATPTIVSPGTENTDITFDYAPGVYHFQLEVVTDDAVPLTVANPNITFVIEPTHAPHVTSLSAVMFWDTTHTLQLEVTDDSWGGSLSYLWTQLSGPVGGVATLINPTDGDSVDVNFNEVPGIYLFQLAVTRGDDALVGTGVFRVAVYTDADQPEDLATGPVTIYVNGVEDQAAILNSSSINKALGQNPQISFKLYDHDIARYSDVVIERGLRRLFGGLCLSTILIFEETNPFRNVNCVGYAWHLHRKPITKTYLNQSLTDIVTDLLTLCDGGITPDFVASGLPFMSIALNNEYPDEALTRMANLIHGHWSVDDFKRMHFAVFEAQGDPITISPRHPWYRDLTITKDATPAVNRVIVNYTRVNTISVDVPDTIEVSSLDNYDPNGGTTQIDGATVHYSGVAKILQPDSVYGHVQMFFGTESVFVSDGQLDPSIGIIPAFTYSTSEGETQIVSGGNGRFIEASPSPPDPPDDNALRITISPITVGDPAAIRRITAINVYRNSNEGAGATFFVGSLPPGGGVFDDKYLLATFPTPLKNAPSINTADKYLNYLTGCTGSAQTSVPASVESNDTAAQADLAAILGGGDSGVVAISLNGGIMGDADARVLADSYLSAARGEKVRLDVTLRDDDAIPGQTLSINYPDAPYECVESVKIQSSSLSGFELGVPHTYRVTAERDKVVLDDFLKKSLNTIQGGT